MILGITGHQERPGIDWAWVRCAVAEEIARHRKPIEGLSSLAKGADQVFAEAILAAGGSLVAIIPISDYEKYFDDNYLTKYKSLLKKSKSIHLKSDGDDEDAFLKAGIYVADHCDILIAVWDGKVAEGKGGTGDVVNHALENRKSFVHIDPFKRKVTRKHG